MFLLMAQHWNPPFFSHLTVQVFGITSKRLQQRRNRYSLFFAKLFFLLKKKRSQTDMLEGPRFCQRA